MGLPFDQRLGPDRDRGEHGSRQTLRLAVSRQAHDARRIHAERLECLRAVAVVEILSGGDGRGRSEDIRIAVPRVANGDETAWLSAFLDARVREMRTEEAHSDVTRVETAQRVFLKNGNLDLNAPLTWKVYGDRFTIPS